MKPELVLVGPLMETTMAALDEAYTVHRLYEAKDREAFFEACAPKVGAIATDGALGADRELMGRLPFAGMIGIFGVGLDAVDLDHARSKGITVTNTPGVLTDDVADLALLLMLAVARRLVVADRFVRQGGWGTGSLPLANRFSGKRIGIVGLGRVGRAVAERCRAFGCAIGYFDPFVSNAADCRAFETPVDLARNSDFLVVTAAGGSGTSRLIDADVLKALGPKGALINVSRGSVVDEDALVGALTGGILGAAGLDVFADEPKVPEALWSLDNVVLSPHRASATVETRQAMGQLLLDNLAAYFAGEPVLTPAF